MPATLTALGAWLSSTVVTGFALTWGQVVLFAAVSAYSATQQARMKRQAKAQYNASQVDRQVNLDTATSASHLVLGRVVKGGTVFFRGSTGQFKETFVMAMEVAKHECDAIESVLFNGEPVTLEADGTGAYIVTSEPYNNGQKATGTATADGAGHFTLPTGWVAGSITAATFTSNSEGNYWTQESVSMSGNTGTTAPGAQITYQYIIGGQSALVWWHLGTDDQAADDRMMELFPDEWTANHRARGVTYIVCKFRYSDVAFPNSLPAVTVVVRGAKMLDPRTGITAWGMNPALQARYVYQHPRFGKATVSSDEDARIIAAANACDTSHVYKLNGTDQPARPLFQSSIVIPFGTTGKDALDDIVQAMGGQWAFAGGELFIKAGVYSAPVLTLTDSDLAMVTRDDGGQVSQSPIGISPHRERVKKFNVVAPRIWDETQNWAEVPLDQLAGSALVTRDGGKLVQEVPFPAITFAPQALHVAGIMMRDARDPMTVQLPFSLAAYQVQLLETITLQIARYGWQAGKVFQVLNRNWTADGKIVLQVKETAAQIFQPDADFVAKGYAENTALPKPGSITVPGPLMIESGTSQLLVLGDGTIIPRVRVTWPAIDDIRLSQSGQVEVQYRPIESTGAWESVLVPGDQTEAYCYNGLQEQRMYVFRARVKLATSTSDWSIQATHIVLGKSQPPADVAGLVASPGTTGMQFFWEQNTEPDYRNTEIRFGTAAQNWYSPGILAIVSSGSSATLIAPVPGSYRAFARHRDTSGNLSANVTTVDFTVTEAQSLAWTNIVGRPKLFRVVTQGFSSSGPIAPGLWDPETGGQYSSVVRSYVLVRISRSTGMPTFVQGYDVYAGVAQASALAADLNATGSDSIVVVYSFDEPQSNRLGGGLLEAMLRCGASRGVFGSPEFRARSAYCLIGIGGCGEGNGFEAYQGAVDADPNAWIDVSFQVQYQQLMVTGMGATPRTLADYSYAGDLDATNGATFGVNISGQAKWSDLEPGAVCDVLPLTVAGPIDVTNPTEIARINIGPYPFDCKLTAIATFSLGLVPTTSGGVQRAWGQYYFDSSVGGVGALYSSPIITDLVSGSFGCTLSGTFDYFAGSTAWIRLMADGQGVISSASAGDVRMRVEVIKR